jgi:hypothetical protein
MVNDNNDEKFMHEVYKKKILFISFKVILIVFLFFLKKIKKTLPESYVHFFWVYFRP